MQAAAIAILKSNTSPNRLQNARRATFPSFVDLPASHLCPEKIVPIGPTAGADATSDEHEVSREGSAQ